MINIIECAQSKTSFDSVVFGITKIQGIIKQTNKQAGK